MRGAAEKKRSQNKQKSGASSEHKAIGGPGFPVVGVGASAGGLEAFKALLEATPADSGCAFVFVQHLAPDHESMMAAILDKHTAMPVVEATDAIVLEPDHVYVIPPNCYIKVADHGLFLDKPLAERGLRMPIDYFFRSLAETMRERAIAVVLSGTGSDGSEGVREIKAAGGMALAQKPETAAYDGMPRSAIRTGGVDFVEVIESIPQRIMDFVQHPYVLPRKEDEHESGGADGLDAIVKLLMNRTSHDFRPYKSGTVGRRIERRMGLRQIETYDEYHALLEKDENEASALFNDLLIGVTRFFRDPEAWEAVSEQVIRPMVRAAQGDEPMRVWVPGCASGEEAYTLAMLFQEVCEAERRLIPWQIFGTDLDPQAIAIARAGRYPGNIQQDVSPERLRRFFVEEGAAYRVVKQLRERLVFAPQNLISDAPFSKLDLISCRNLLIYLEPEVQNKIIEMFHFALAPGGKLLLGSSETVGRRSDLFRTLSGTWRIFQRTGKPVSAGSRFPMSSRSRDTEGRRTSSVAAGQAPNIHDIARRTLLSRFAPASVIADAEGEARYYYGPVRRYLDTPEGEPTANIFECAAMGLKMRLREALAQAAREKKRAVLVAPRVVRDGMAVAVQIEAEPIENPESGEGLFLISFNDREEPDEPDQGDRGAQSDVGSDQATQADMIGQLEYELRVTREDLQSTIEELETSNEELKASHEESMSANEELQSTNEELETSREELQSLNEELVTVNSQLEDKIDELEKTNNDLANLLASTDIAVIFLGSDMCIRRFTPAAREVMNIIDSDIGRPISDLAPRVSDDTLLADAEEVLRKLTPRDGEVRSPEGRWYTRRVRPYRTADNKIDGVVVTFTDVTHLKETAAYLQARERQQAAAAELGRHALETVDTHAVFDAAVARLITTLGADFAKVLRLEDAGEELLLVSGAGWQDDLVGSARVENSRRSQAGYTLRSRSPVVVEDLEQEGRFAGPPLLTDHGVRSGISCIIGSTEDPWGVLGVHSREVRRFTNDDISFIQSVANILYAAIVREAAQREVADRELKLNLALDAANLATWSWNLETDESFWDDRLRRLIGAEDNEPASGSAFFQRIVPEQRDYVRDKVVKAVNERSALDLEFQIERPDGSRPWITSRGDVLRGGRVLMGVNYDITEQKRMEEKQELIARELDHRVKNVLATVTSIANMTSSNAETLGEFRESFAARIQSMSRTHGILAAADWNGAELTRLLDDELHAYRASRNVKLQGPDVVLQPNAAQCLSLTIHELATNAAKHGAFRNRKSALSVEWAFVERDGERYLDFEWREKTKGVKEPKRSGFGTRVITDLVRNQLDADVELEFPETGMVYRASIPFEGNISPYPTGKTGEADEDFDASEEVEGAAGHTADPSGDGLLLGRKILVVDDEWLVAAHVEGILLDAGATIVGPFYNVDDATAALDDHSPELAIIDYNLGGKPVTPVARRLRKEGIPTLLVTGYGSNLKLAKDLEGTPHVTKPVTAGTLLKRLKDLLAQPQ